MFRPTKGSEIETKFRGTCAVVYFGRHSLTLQCMVSQAQNHLFGQIGPSGVRRNMRLTLLISSLILHVLTFLPEGLYLGSEILHTNLY